MEKHQCRRSSGVHFGSNTISNLHQRFGRNENENTKFFEDDTYLLSNTYNMNMLANQKMILPNSKVGLVNRKLAHP